MVIRVLFHYFERFVAEYEERFEKAYGYFHPIVKDVVEKYLRWCSSGASMIKGWNIRPPSTATRARPARPAGPTITARGGFGFMAPSHAIPSFWNPEYVKLQKNALRWLLRES